MKLKLIRIRTRGNEESFFDTETCEWHTPAGGIGVAYASTKIVSNMPYQFGKNVVEAIELAKLTEIGEVITVKGASPYIDQIVRLT